MVSDYQTHSRIEGGATMFDNDLAYYQSRADEEREKAATASEQAIADIHLALVAKYEALIEQGTSPSPFSGGMGTLSA
jgi:hypothetical protein